MRLTLVALIAMVLSIIHSMAKSRSRLAEGLSLLLTVAVGTLLVATWDGF